MSVRAEIEGAYMDAVSYILKCAAVSLLPAPSPAVRAAMAKAKARQSALAAAEASLSPRQAKARVAKKPAAATTSTTPLDTAGTRGQKSGRVTSAEAAAGQAAQPKSFSPSAPASSPLRNFMHSDLKRNALLGAGIGALSGLMSSDPDASVLGRAAMGAGLGMAGGGAWNAYSRSQRGAAVAAQRRARAAITPGNTPESRAAADASRAQLAAARGKQFGSYWNEANAAALAAHNQGAVDRARPDLAAWRARVQAATTPARL